ncbi:MAG TPA: excinuclease ABC subunit UvrC [Bdellovibrionota bacterium]|nr:excinuclease ABC subunit UvrC [Bdellovibrionota bacterium]
MSDESPPDWKSVLDQKVAEAPLVPGVYLYKDAAGKVIYVGKAKVLRHRVRSYFKENLIKDSPKTVVLMSHVREVEFVTVTSEAEALVLENNLIKKFRPKYNIRLKDDKTYPFIRIDMAHEYPRAYVARKPSGLATDQYFGPYPDSYSMRTALSLSSKIFKLRDCRDHEFANRARPCLSHQIGHCTAPCVGLVSREKYAQQVTEYFEFLKGDRAEKMEEWEAQMLEASEATDFERAAMLRDRMAAMKAIADQEQVVVDPNDLSPKDLWVFAPSDESQLESLGLAAFLVFQFRSGGLVGRNYRAVEVGDFIEGEDLKSLLVMQYYAKNPAPPLIVLETRNWEDSQRRVLEEALETLLGKDAEVARLDLSVASESDKGSYAKIFDIARANLASWYRSELARRESQLDGLAAIQDMIGLEKKPRRLECVDISNFQGEANVGSLVVFVDGRPDKSFYRHYKIKSVHGQDDFSSIQEVVRRRFTGVDAPIRPDLLIIDGGRGQLSAAKETLDALGIDVPVVGLAKARGFMVVDPNAAPDPEAAPGREEERIFMPGQKNPLKIRSAAAMSLFVRIRDEAHRFAITFHRSIRKRNRYQ